MKFPARRARGKAMLETRDVPGATELEAPSRRPPIRGVNETPHSIRRSPEPRRGEIRMSGS